MTKINTGGSVEYTPTKSNKFNKILYTIALALSLGYSSPANAQSTTSNADNNDNIELTTSMSNHKENHDGYSIPPIYKDKIESILKENLPVVSIDGTSSWMFTIDFVLKEMEADWGISKDNQLLFIWNSICKQLIGENIYDGEDGDSSRLEEYKASVGKVRLCGKRYKELIMPYIEKKSAEYDRRTARANEQAAEARERTARANEQSAIAIKEAMSADTLGIKEMVGYYKIHEQNPKTTDKNRLKEVVRLSKIIVDDCKKRDINYRDIIQKEVEKVYPELKGTEIRWKVDSIINFYEGGYDAEF